MDDSLHPIFRTRPAPDARLWRYLSFAKFASLLQSKCLHFTRVDQFDDHFEGAWPKSDLEWWSKLSEKGFNPAWFTESMRPRVAASCWIGTKHESAAMWRLYARGDEGVAVTTTFAKLEAAVVPFAESHPHALAGASRVSYADHFTEGLIEKLGPDEHVPNGLAPFMIKNRSYEYEQEVRALLVAGVGHEIAQAGCNIPMDPADFIDEVVVNPFCQSWFTEAVAGIANQYGLKKKMKRSSLSPDVFYPRVPPAPSGDKAVTLGPP